MNLAAQNREVGADALEVKRRPARDQRHHPASASAKSLASWV